MPAHTTSGSDPVGRQRAPRGRFLAAMRPAPDPGRLVPVAEVRRGAVRLAQSWLADVELSPVVQEVAVANGAARFRVLVAARDADLAREVLAGL